jgi:hypothetical protein
MKKLWVSVKRGLVRDTKHRIAMGECVWMFMYMLDIADWETGVISDWKDEAASEDMQMPIRTIRDQRRKLEELNYVSCEKKQYSQSITILNWTNPREYSGAVYNPKQSDTRPSPSRNAQSDTQSDTQSSSQSVTPTSYSKIKNHGTKVPEGVSIEWQLVAGQEITQQDQFMAQVHDAANIIDMGCLGAGNLALAFMTTRKIIIPESKIKGNRKAAREMLEMKVKPEHVRQATLDLISKKMTVTDLFSISRTAIDIANPAKTTQNDRTGMLRTITQ